MESMTSTTTVVVMGFRLTIRPGRQGGLLLNTQTQETGWAFTEHLTDEFIEGHRTGNAANAHLQPTGRRPSSYLYTSLT